MCAAHHWPNNVTSIVTENLPVGCSCLRITARKTGSCMPAESVQLHCQMYISFTILLLSTQLMQHVAGRSCISTSVAALNACGFAKLVRMLKLQDGYEPETVSEMISMHI